MQILVDVAGFSISGFRDPGRQVDRLASFRVHNLLLCPWLVRRQWQGRRGSRKPTVVKSGTCHDHGLSHTSRVWTCVTFVALGPTGAIPSQPPPEIRSNAGDDLFVVVVFSRPTPGARRLPVAGYRTWRHQSGNARDVSLKGNEHGKSPSDTTTSGGESVHVSSGADSEGQGGDCIRSGVPPADQTSPLRCQLFPSLPGRHSHHLGSSTRAWLALDASVAAFPG